MNNNLLLCPVILAGGGGTRLWPLSREHYPKQFLSFSGDESSMLQQSLLRITGMEGPFTLGKPVLVCNEEHRFLVAEHARLSNVEPGEIILEPRGRNTAPALTIAALRAGQEDPVLLMMPADHHINDTGAFRRAVLSGYQQAAAGKLVTFGIKPLYPETGYGYLHAGRQMEGDAWGVSRFVEKPDLDTARQYMSSGEYFWNSGIFMMKASVWLDAIGKFRPDILSACETINQHSRADGIFSRLGREFAECPEDSIDYAVMEKACRPGSGFESAMIVLDAGWSDLGSWSAIWDASKKDGDDNVLKGDVLAEDTRNSIIHAHSRLVATIGCENLLVIETSDAVLVGPREQSQRVKQIVDRLKKANRDERINHRRVFRPWGNYETLDVGTGFQVKRLVVSPGKKLSLQLHHRRAEHWVVVSGVATVTCGDRTFDLYENQSTFIPLGEKHRLENKHQAPLEVIEVQSGDYLGEDDIVRFDDDFGRHAPQQ